MQNKTEYAYDIELHDDRKFMVCFSLTDNYYKFINFDFILSNPRMDIADLDEYGILNEEFELSANNFK